MKSQRGWLLILVVLVVVGIPFSVFLIKGSDKTTGKTPEGLSAGPTTRSSPETQPPSSLLPHPLIPKPLAELHSLLAGGAWDEDLIPSLIALEDWIAQQAPDDLVTLLQQTLDSTIPVRERGLLLLALSASTHPSVKHFLVVHVVDQGEIAVAFAYSLALKSQRLSFSRDDREGFWRGAFLVPTLSDLIAPDYVRQYHAKSLNLTDLSKVPEEALQEPVRVGSVFITQIMKPLPDETKQALLGYLDRGPNSKASQEMVFLVPWDGEFAALAKRVYEDASRDLSLRQRVLTGYIQSTGSEVLSNLLLWAGKEQDPELLQVIATGLCSRGSASTRKAEIVAVFANMLAVQALDPSTVTHLTTHLAMLNAPEGVELLARLSVAGTTKDVELNAIKALGTNTGASDTVPARAQVLIEWMSSGDPAKRIEAGYSLYNLAAIGTKDRVILERVVNALQGLRDSLTEKTDQAQFNVMLVTLRSKLK